MALYRVVCDGTDILDYSRKDLVLLNPHLDMEINTAGSLEFVMPPYHAFYDAIQILRSTIEVYEDEQLIWFGRPIETSIDFYKQKTVFCEGPLAFFNDTIMFPVEFDGELNRATVHSFWKYIIEQHNKQMSNPNRKFEYGICTMPDKEIYRKLNYENAHDALQQMCLNAEDGYFFFRRVGGVNYFDWYKEMPYACNQPIEFGRNLLDLNSDFNAASMATCVIPLGKTVDGNPITIDSVNNGSDILVSEAANTYGRIIHVENFSDISDPTELKAEGEKYLTDSQFNSWEIQCTAADLHSQNTSLDSFTVGQQVLCVSNPHLINRSFPISKISIKLDSAAKTVTLGIIKRKSLTRIRKEDNTPNDVESTGTDGSPWEIDPPLIPGDTPTMSLMPTGIVIERPPNKVIYRPGESIDYTGIKVRIMYGNEVWKKRPLYTDGYAPFNELTFSAKMAPNVKNFSSNVIWTYNGQRFYSSIALSSEDSHDEPITLRIYDEDFDHLHPSKKLMILRTPFTFKGYYNFRMYDPVQSKFFTYRTEEEITFPEGYVWLRGSYDENTQELGIAYFRFFANKPSSISFRLFTYNPPPDGSDYNYNTTETLQTSTINCGVQLSDKTKWKYNGPAVMETVSPRYIVQFDTIFTVENAEKLAPVEIASYNDTIYYHPDGTPAYPLYPLFDHIDASVLCTVYGEQILGT